MESSSVVAKLHVVMVRDALKISIWFRAIDFSAFRGFFMKTSLLQEGFCSICLGGPDKSGEFFQVSKKNKSEEVSQACLARCYLERTED